MIFFFLLSLLIYLQINIIYYFQEDMNQLECTSYMNVISLIDYSIQNWIKQGNYFYKNYRSYFIFQTIICAILKRL